MHWQLAKTFQRRYPKVQVCSQEVLTEQDGILRAAGTAYMDLALHLVEKFAGANLAAATAKILLIDANRASQASYRTMTAQDYLAPTDPLVARAQRWMEKRLQQPSGWVTWRAIWASANARSSAASIVRSATPRSPICNRFGWRLRNGCWRRRG